MAKNDAGIYDAVSVIGRLGMRWGPGYRERAASWHVISNLVRSFCAHSRVLNIRHNDVFDASFRMWPNATPRPRAPEC